MPDDELEPLITECPSCQTQFRVSEMQLERAGGRVRCGACLTVFHGGRQLVMALHTDERDPEQVQQALDDLLDELAAGDAAAAERANPEPRRQEPAPVAGPAVARDRVPEQAPAQAASAEPGPGAAHLTEPVAFGEPRPRHRPLVWIGMVTGLLLLMVQVLWYQFDDWAKEQHWRPLYAAICGALGCELPVQQDLAELSTRHLVVRSHPREADALLVNAVIVNGADFPQPFPVLELQFTTVRGNLAASRRFHPDEYLAGDGRGMDLMPRRTPVQIELIIDDPGPDAVNYRLNFR